MNRICKIISVFFFTAAVLSGCGNDAVEQTSSKKKPIKLPVVKVSRAVEGSISKTYALTGSVAATKVAEMGSPAEGPVMECMVREGDKVITGQKLLTIGRKKAADSLVKASKDGLKREQDELKRVRKLVQSGAIPAEELDIANLMVSRAKADLSRDMEKVEDYVIEAPWNGLVSKVFVTDGHYVDPREHLVEIYDPKSLVVEFAVPEIQSAGIYVGMPVEVAFDAFPGKQFTGKISRIYPELNRQTRTRIAEVDVAGENSIKLFPGMFSRVKLVLQTITNAVLILDKAIVMTPSGEQLVYIVEDKKVHSRKVKTGIEQGRMIQVINNLRAGEKVVIDGNEKLSDGAAVKVISSEMKKKTVGAGKIK